MNARRAVKPPVRDSDTKIKTAAQVRAEFEASGTAVSDWAAKHGFKPSLVFEVLEGRVKGKRGKGHRIAVLLGLKAGEIRA